MIGLGSDKNIILLPRSLLKVNRSKRSIQGAGVQSVANWPIDGSKSLIGTKNYLGGQEDWMDLVFYFRSTRSIHDCVHIPIKLWFGFWIWLIVLLSQNYKLNFCLSLFLFQIMVDNTWALLCSSGLDNGTAQGPNCTKSQLRYLCWSEIRMALRIWIDK